MAWKILVSFLEFGYDSFQSWDCQDLWSIHRDCDHHQDKTLQTCGAAKKQRSVLWHKFLAKSLPWHGNIAIGPIRWYTLIDTIKSLNLSDGSILCDLGTGSGCIGISLAMLNIYFLFVIFNSYLRNTIILSCNNLLIYDLQMVSLHLSKLVIEGNSSFIKTLN